MATLLSFIHSIFAGDRYEWRLPTSVEETKRRLVPLVDRRNRLERMGASEVHLKFNGTHFIVSKSSGKLGLDMSQNPFARRLHGEIIADGSRSLIQARLQLPWSTSVYWGVLLLVTAVALVSVIVTKTTPSLFAYVCLAGMIMGFVVGKRIARMDESDLIWKLNQTLGEIGVKVKE